MVDNLTTAIVFSALFAVITIIVVVVSVVCLTPRVCIAIEQLVQQFRADLKEDLKREILVTLRQADVAGHGQTNSSNQGHETKSREEGPSA